MTVAVIIAALAALTIVLLAAEHMTEIGDRIDQHIADVVYLHDFEQWEKEK